MKGKQFQLLIRHPAYYSYIQSIPVKVLAVIEERKNLCKKYKNPLLFLSTMSRNITRDVTALDIVLPQRV